MCSAVISAGLAFNRTPFRENPRYTPLRPLFRILINAYLAQLPQPQIAFSVRQKQPNSLDDAVAATLEMESYLPPHTQVSSGVSSTLPTEDKRTASGVDSIDKVAQLTRVVERLAERVEKLQQKAANAEHQTTQAGINSEYQPRREPPPRRRRGFTGECWSRLGTWPATVPNPASKDNSKTRHLRHCGPRVVM